MTSFRDVQKQIDRILAELEARNAEIEKDFDPHRDEIALRITSLTMLKNTDWPKKIMKIFPVITIVTRASDGSQLRILTQAGESPLFAVKKNEPLQFERPFVLYGPDNPGETIDWRIDFFDDDRQVRKVAKSIAKLTKDPSYQKKLDDFTKSFNSQQLEAGTALVNFVGGFIADEVSKSKDKHLGTFTGTLLRDEPRLGTYGLKDPYWTERNAYLKLSFRVEPIMKDDPADKLRGATLTKMTDTVRFKPTVVRP